MFGYYIEFLFGAAKYSMITALSLYFVAVCVLFKNFIERKKCAKPKCLQVAQGVLVDQNGDYHHAY